jgi:hypothetical protein
MGTDKGERGAAINLGETQGMEGMGSVNCREFFVLAEAEAATCGEALKSLSSSQVTTPGSSLFSVGRAPST